MERTILAHYGGKRNWQTEPVELIDAIVDLKHAFCFSHGQLTSVDRKKVAVEFKESDKLDDVTEWFKQFGHCVTHFRFFSLLDSAKRGEELEFSTVTTTKYVWFREDYEGERVADSCVPDTGTIYLYGEKYVCHSLMHGMTVKFNPHGIDLDKLVETIKSWGKRIDYDYLFANGFEIDFWQTFGVYKQVSELTNSFVTFIRTDKLARRVAELELELTKVRCDVESAEHARRLADTVSYYTVSGGVVNAVETATLSEFISVIQTHFDKGGVDASCSLVVHVPSESIDFMRGKFPSAFYVSSMIDLDLVHRLNDLTKSQMAWVVTKE